MEPNYKRMFKMTQDDWIKECQKIDRLLIENKSLKAENSGLRLDLRTALGLLKQNKIIPCDTVLGCKGCPDCKGIDGSDWQNFT